MSRSRLRVGFRSVVVAIGLMVLGVQPFAPVAAAAQPRVNARAFGRAMQVQNRHTERLMAIPGVVGTATGVDPAGQPVVKVFLERRGIRGIPARLEGLPVAAEVTGTFFALRAPRRPSPHRPPPRRPPSRPPPSRRPPAGRDNPPTVEIIYPADGASVSGLVRVAAEARDDQGVDRVEFFVDDQSDPFWVDEDGSDGWAGEWDTASLDEGWHLVTAVATDTAAQTAGDGVSVKVVTGASPYPRPAPIGVSTGHPLVTAGTIGCRVTDGTFVYALSNNHIYANCNQAAIGDNVLQPGPWDGGIDSRDAIGMLADFQAIVFSRRAQNTMDAAIALSSEDLLGNATPMDGYGTPNSLTVPAVVGLKVMKYGRTTILTKGSVASINAAVTVSYGDAGVARFVGQIVISPGSFSGNGDSGALVVTDDEGQNPVGLLFAGSSSYTICSPIDAVLDRFNVTVDGTVENGR
jgi:hypothetical protein